MKKSGYVKKSLYILLFQTIILLGGLILWLNALISRTADAGMESMDTYRYHYAMVVDSSDDIFWDMVYEGAESLAAENDTYLELIQNRLSSPFSLADLLGMTFAARVDGILLVSDGSEEVEKAILRNAQSENPLPLLTVMEEERPEGSLGYVGIDRRELGRCYAALMEQLSEERSISTVVLLQSAGSDADSVLSDSICASLPRSGRAAFWSS